MRQEPEKWEALTSVSFLNIYLEGCRGAALEHSGVHLHTQGRKQRWSNVFLHYPPLHPNSPPYSTLLLAQLASAFQRRGQVSAPVPAVHIQIHTYTQSVLASEKQNPSLALFSSPTVQSQKRMETAAATVTLQENELKDSSKARSVCGVRNAQGQLRLNHLIRTYSSYLYKADFSAFIWKFIRGSKRTVKIYVDFLLY